MGLVHTYFSFAKYFLNLQHLTSCLYSCITIEASFPSPIDPYFASFRKLKDLNKPRHMLFLVGASPRKDLLFVY